MASIVSCVVLVSVLYLLGEHFHVLPKAVLASIVIVNLKRLYAQVDQVIPLWKCDRVNCVIWIVTFCSVLLFGILIGFFIGCVTVMIGMAHASTKLIVNIEGETIKVYGALTYLTIEQVIEGHGIVHASFAG